MALKEKPATLKSCFGLLKNPYVLLMVIGIFLYVGSEVSMSAKLPNFLEAKFDYNIKEKGLFGTLFFFISLMTGRFLGGVILNWLSPKKFLIYHQYPFHCWALPVSLLLRVRFWPLYLFSSSDWVLPISSHSSFP